MNKRGSEIRVTAVVMTRCQNCGIETAVADLKEIKGDIRERVNPGEVMPYGECPECRALCHAVE